MNLILFYALLAIPFAVVALSWFEPKRMAPVLLAASLQAQQPQSFHVDTWRPNESNHGLHAWYGFQIGALTGGLAIVLGYGDPQAKSWAKRNLKPWMHSLGWAVLFGFGKEFYDRRHGGRPAWPDAAYTAAGGALVAIPIHLGTRAWYEFATAPKLEH